MFGSFLGKFKVLFKSPMTLFVYGIMSKWYITIFVTAVVVSYWVFKGLGDAGVLKKSEEVIFSAFTQTKSVAQYCIPKIANLGDFWDCLQNPPAYVPSDEEIGLEKKMKIIMDPANSNKVKDPYQ